MAIKTNEIKFCFQAPDCSRKSDNKSKCLAFSCHTRYNKLHSRMLCNSEKRTAFSSLFRIVHKT